VPRVSRDITRADRLGAWRVRWGFGRDDYRVKPGLYALGAPVATSPVLVTSNYKLTLDQLRSSLDELDAWLLVVDTGHQRLVRGREGHVLRRGGRSRGSRDAAG
jgi:CO dehydrogenase/acetyl-CoA synthase gamma subunit (corrinoid Fe-S protein)